MNHDTPGYDKRGSAQARRRRRVWLMSPAAGFGGNLASVPCYHCKHLLGPADMEVDRFPICGHDGGSYRRDNIVPSCRYCNVNRCEKCKGIIAAAGGLLERQTRLPVGAEPWPEDEPCESV